MKATLQSNIGLATIRTFVNIYILSQKNRIRLKRFSFRDYVVILFLAGYWIGGFVFFYWSFRYIHQFTVVGDLLLDRIWHFFFFILWMMLIFSNAVVAYGTQYRAQETFFLMSLPIPVHSIYLKQWAETLIFSSWAFLFLSVPMILAYGFMWGGSGIFIVWSLLFIVPFIVTASVAGCLTCALFIYLRKLGGQWLIYFLWAGVLVLLFRLLYFQAQISDSSDPEIIVFLQDFLSRFGFSKSFWMPSTWLASGTVFFVRGMNREASILLFLSWSHALFFADVLLFLAKRYYAQIWEQSQGSSASQVRSKLSKMFMSLRLSAIFKKDMLTLFRDPSQWVQLLVLSIIFCFYLMNLKNMKLYVDHPFWENAIFFMNVTAIALFVSTLCLRFVFVQYSLEWKRQWLMALVPMSKRSFIQVKFYTYLGLTLILSELFSWLTNRFIGAPTGKIFLAALLIFYLDVGLVAISLGLGIIYPFFGSDNPSKIMSGMGGILALITLLSFILGFVSPFSMIYHWLSVQKMTPVNFTFYFMMLAIIDVLFLAGLLFSMYRICEKNLWRESP